MNELSAPFSNGSLVSVGDQEPRHLQYVADLEDLNVYTVVNSRKLYGAPADFTFCFKVSTWSGGGRRTNAG